MVVSRLKLSSRPLLSRSGCISEGFANKAGLTEKFSSPFIEERLYFLRNFRKNDRTIRVLVPFYRGAVIFPNTELRESARSTCSRPLLSRSGCIFLKYEKDSTGIPVLVPFYRGAVVFQERK